MGKGDPGVYILKIWVIGWLGKKYDDMVLKNANLREKSWENWDKEEIFIVP